MQRTLRIGLLASPLPANRGDAPKAGPATARSHARAVERILQTYPAPVCPDLEPAAIGHLARTALHAVAAEHAARARLTTR
ncbi:hypothetical protein ROJ8625_02576 [Roseivivax jejudonensis]|uniref:Uncharacterized protein n=1 Tax=Roseivivax jejudonensis TaxID=1529041 RepID=A0A1X6ZJX3_9RHOB|nr:hypothetical protein [Roseivivax jejudonensis]SLN51609.1 hypothetical protein ROJ8625_02576 [Roseivivax jejudonensis]